MAMKPGRFWFSRAQAVGDPRARCSAAACRASPQFISISDGSWFGTSACIERMTQMSSMCSAVLREQLADLDAALAVLAGT